MTYNQALNVAGLKRPVGKQLKDPDVIAAFTEKMPLSGQKSVGHVTYWGNVTKDKNDKPWFKIENGKKRTTPTPQEIKDEKLKQYWFLRETAIFALEQMNHVPEVWLEKRNMLEKTINRDIIEGKHDTKLEQIVQQLIAKNGVEVIHDPATKTPCYIPSLDKIQMPPIHMFENDSRYYHTLLHEMVHSTGAAHRLNRESLSNYHVDESIRAYEELVAELGGLFMSLELGIKPITSENLMNHASYIKSWMQALTDDLSSGSCTFLNQASKDAEKAVDYLINELELKKEYTQETKKEKAPESEPESLTP